MEDLIKSIKLHENNPDELSKIALEIGANVYYLNTEMAKAELAEKKILTEYLKQGATIGQKRSVAESEVYSVVQSGNEYGIKKAQAEALVEYLNLLKMRLKVLIWEKTSLGSGMQ